MGWRFSTACRKSIYKVSPEHFSNCCSHVRMHEHIHDYTNTDTLITDNYTVKAALDIPTETCLATSNVPTS